MRDPKRIKKVTNILTEIWETPSHKDMRFGQLISNVIGEIAAKHDVVDIWFPEDDKWEEWLQEYLDSISGPIKPMK